VSILVNSMNTSLRNVVLIWAIPILLGIALATGLAWPRTGDSTVAAEKAGTGAVQSWAKVTVEFPTSHTAFPPGNGADIANGQCLICHSAGMVLRQAPLTVDEWTGEINKMRNSFGAPLPADQVAALARYLHSINGRQDSSSPSAVDRQGS
jgi:mono/diheme cytochrome c family protein